MRIIEYVTNENEILYDFNTIKNILGVNKSKLQREMNKIEGREYVKYKNQFLFKEKTHSKRGAGFITIPDQRFLHEKCNNINIKDEIKRIFIDAFGKNDKLCATNLIDRIKKV